MYSVKSIGKLKLGVGVGVPSFISSYVVLISSTQSIFVSAHDVTETTLPPIALQQSDDGSKIQLLFCHISISSSVVEEPLKLFIKEFSSFGSSSLIVNTMKFLQSMLSKDTSLNIVG